MTVLSTKIDRLSLLALVIFGAYLLLPLIV